MSAGAQRRVFVEAGGLRLSAVVDEPSPGAAGRSSDPEASARARAGERCAAERPPLAELAPGHRAACWHPVEAAA